MTNEEKILELLIVMQRDISGLKEDEFTRVFRIIYHKKKFKTQASEEFLRFLKSDEIETIIQQ